MLLFPSNSFGSSELSLLCQFNTSDNVGKDGDPRAHKIALQIPQVPPLRLPTAI